MPHASSRFAVGHTHEATCPQCKRRFMKTEEWVFRYTIHNHLECLCSWSCLREAEKAHQAALEEKRKRREHIGQYNSRQLTDDEKCVIRDMYIDGDEIKEICDTLGRSYHAVSDYIRSIYGICSSPERRKLVTE